MTTVNHHVSELGRWVHASCRPPQLAGLVESVWYFEGSLSHRREWIFPDGRVELNVHFDKPYRQHVDGRVEVFPATCFSGPLLRGAVLEAPQSATAVLGIRFLPAGASALIGHPLHELAGLTVDLRALLGRAAAELHQRCEAAVGAQARIGAAVRWLEERASRAEVRWRSDDHVVAWAAREIEQRRGAVSITELRERVGWPRSRLVAAFRERTGVAPKQLARIVRFRCALEMLHAGGLSLSAVALRAGYYDQPHLNRDFRDLAGMTPGDYLSARRYPGSVNLAEV